MLILVLRLMVIALGLAVLKSSDVGVIVGVIGCGGRNGAMSESNTGRGR